MKKSTTIVFLMLLVSQPAMAFTTFGAPDCGQWVQQPEATKRAWLLGYMSGLSAMFDLVKDERDPLGEINSADQIYVWMNNFCQKNPLFKVHQGGTNLFIELMKKKAK